MKKWTLKKKIFVFLLAAFIVMQFFQPARNGGEAYGPSDYTHSLTVPADVRDLIEKSCFDCHSNRTNHQWYERIQPFGWWMNSHIAEGKEELNFSEFNTYTDKRKAHKLEETAEMIENGEMPLSSYLWMHSEARMNEEQKKKITDWALNGMKAFGGEEEHEEKE